MSRSHHHSRPVHLHQRIYGLLFIPVILLVAAYVVAIPASVGGGDVSAVELGAALCLSFVRLLAAFVLALLVAIPFSLLIHRSPLVERSVLPLLDTSYSVPVLAFFPVLILVFNQYHFLEGAAVSLIVITMVWALVINSVAGLRSIPSDIHDTAKVLGIKGLKKIRHVVLPAIIPSIVSGSLLAWAAGWNMLLVAEVLHNYTPGRSSEGDLFGIGSVIVHAAAAGQNSLFIGAMITMLAAILLMNFFIWQRLQDYAERYRFE
ncbi:MAG TPA: ABC transporter permease subunit [Candidatus Saccharimonadia bacterium]